MNALFISGIFMSFFIVLLLLTKKDKALTDRILAAWVAVIGIHLLGYHFKQIGYWELYPHLIGVTAPVPLLHGPLLYLYTLYALRSDHRIRKYDFLHFIPVTLAYLYMSGFFFLYSAEEKLLVDRGETSDYRTFMTVLLTVILMSGTGYSLAAYRLTWLHKRKIETNYSFREGITLGWLRYCILVFGFMFLSAVIIVLMREGMGWKFPFNADYIFYTLIILFIFCLGYFGIRHQNIFSENPSAVNPEKREEESGEKYSRSGLKEEAVDSIHEKMLRMMEEKKPYLDPRLSLSQLAGITGVSPNHLSQVINQRENVSFNDFVNKYRVDEFIRQAGVKKHFSILALALDAGFNSKSSFNSVFKKHTGFTPSAYLSEKLQADKKTE